MFEVKYDDEVFGWVSISHAGPEAKGDKYTIVPSRLLDSIDMASDIEFEQVAYLRNQSWTVGE